MNIVCVSYNAPPRNDAEAFCTARFLSALADSGTKVHLVTAVHDFELEEITCSELISDRIVVKRLELPPKEEALIPKLRMPCKYRYCSDHIEFIDQAVRFLSEFLPSIKDPILITRGSPSASHVVGNYVKKYAFKWIAHFSDPYPGIGVYSRRNIYMQWHDTFWARAIITSADLISVTNRHAEKWFRLTHKLKTSVKFHIAEHIGTPALSPEQGFDNFDSEFLNYAHVGFWGKKRYLSKILAGFDSFSKKNEDFRLYQYGVLDPDSRDVLPESCNKWFKLHEGLMNPQRSSAVITSESINIVVDQGDGLDFCPYLASKFAYAVSSGKPLLAMGQANSEMSMLYQEYGSFYFVDIEKTGALETLLKRISKIGYASLVRPSADLMKRFEPQIVAESFIQSIQEISSKS